MKYGILLENILPSQLAFFVINHFNELLANNVKDTAFFFLDNITLPIFINPLCPIMNSTEIGQFNDGVILTTTINHTKQAINSINNSKIIFYVWDLEWIRKPMDYLSNIEVFRNPRIEIVAKTKEQAEIISKYANITNVRVVEDCNMKEILKW